MRLACAFSWTPPVLSRSPVGQWDVFGVSRASDLGQPAPALWADANDLIKDVARRKRSTRPADTPSRAAQSDGKQRGRSPTALRRRCRGSRD